MKREQDQKLMMKTAIVCSLGLIFGLGAQAAPPETNASISAPSPSSKTLEGQEEKAWEALEEEEEQKKEQTTEATDEEEDLLDEPQITCERLIVGDLEVKGDARANLICNQAMLSCMGYICLQKAIQNGTNSFSQGTTRSLLKTFKEESRKWRLMCEVTRNVSQDPGFMDMFTQTPEPSRALKTLAP